MSEPHSSNESSSTVTQHSQELEKDIEAVYPPPKEAINENDPDIDGGYAWVILAAGVMFNFCTWGMNSGFAIYFAHYIENDTFEGATKIDYAYIGGIAFGVGLFFSPLVIYMRGIVGYLPILILGNILQFTSLMLASWSKKLWQLYLTQGLMQSFGLAFLSLIATPIIGEWFKKKRVFANGAAAAGSGLGGIVFNLGMQKVVETRDVHWALRAQAIIGFGITWIAILLVRSKASTHKLEFNLFEFSVFKFAGVYYIICFVLCCIFGYVILLYTLANWVQTLGYSSYQASIVSAMVQVGSLFGRPCVGLLSDKFGGATVASIAYIVAGIFCLAMWIPARNYATAVIFALIEGALMGSVYAVIAPVIARTFGLAKMNVVFAQVWVLMGTAGIFSPVIGAKLVKGSAASIDPTAYQNCAIFAGIMYLAAGGFLLLLRGYLKARDHIFEKDGLTDSDYQDYTSVRVPVIDVFTNIFAKSKEKA
ncbi:uncharacterized protein KGF55_004843 [Candida pseudojiufengensis]|uniref:uncharacterized protein n=1 Tax=Candida pseudojiufengensis TaxID=497109 RepID=UPI00222536B9|nr:uncharacterized protein KGF55_004843 [Candida pseudojiufengensis]KAI5960120.1 hypothetical protein KGF55_004843 [Candida pseudojiufengensis]